MPSPTGNDLTLVGLPLELVQHIGSYLNDNSDALLMLRRTCKDLEAALLRQFVHEHVASLYCWMSDVKRWQRIERILDSRLGQHVKKITFTLDVMEHRHDSDVPTVDNQWLYVSRRFLPMGEIRFVRAIVPYVSLPAQNICDEELSAPGFRRPSPPEITSLLCYAKSYGISLHFDFGGYIGPQRALLGSRVARDLLSAATIVRPSIEQITVANVVLSWLGYVLGVHGSDFVKLVRAADHVVFLDEGTRGHGDQSLAEEWRQHLESVFLRKRRL